MKVKGTMDVQVDVRPEEAISIIEDYLGLNEKGQYSKFEILDKDGERAIYQVTDNSWYGSYNDNYSYITNDKNKIAIFEAFQLLKNVIRHNEKLL